MSWFIGLMVTAAIVVAIMKVLERPLARRKAADEFGFDPRLWQDLGSRPVLYNRAAEGLRNASLALQSAYITQDKARESADRALTSAERQKADTAVLSAVASVAFRRCQFNRLEKLARRARLNCNLKTDKRGRVRWQDLTRVEEV